MIDVIINPVAGNGLALRVGEEIIASLEKKGIAYHKQITEYPGHGRELAVASAKAGVDTVMAIGGDGTAYEVASGLIHTKTALAIIPGGTGNDVVKTLGIPKKPLEALEHILSHPARTMDMGQINDQIFLNVCGTGFDVSVLEYAEKAKRYVRGLLPYLYGVIRTIFSFRPVKMRIALDGKELEGDHFLICAIANGRYIGGGIPIAPSADIHDGLLDVMVLKSIPNWKLPRYLPGLLSGKIEKFPITSHYLCKEVSLDAPGMKMNVDGEILPMNNATFAPLKDALWMHW